MDSDSSLEKRLRIIMKREGLTYEKVAEYADTSKQAVHKWLKNGSITDEKALNLASKIGLDWIWLKHGISKIPVDNLYDVIHSSTSNLILSRWDTFELLAVGEGLAQSVEYDAKELIGISLLDLVPLDEEEYPQMKNLLFKGQKIIYSLSGMVEHSFRATFQDKYTLRAVKVRGLGHTTDEHGIPYAFGRVDFVEPNGHENKISSLRLYRKTWQPPSKEIIEELCLANPELPWLRSFLSK